MDQPCEGPSLIISLQGKKELIVGIANAHSIAFGCAMAFRDAGADLAVTYLNKKALPYVEPLAKQLDSPIVVPCDVREPGQLEAVFSHIAEQWGHLDFLLHFTATDAKGELLLDQHLTDGTTHEDALAVLLRWLDTRFQDYELLAAGHRVVHGGALYSAPVRIDDAVIAELRRLIPLAPLHQPHHLAAIVALAKFGPLLPQFACFDTAFHHDQPTVATAFALPRRLTDEGVRRYGFHGLSNEYPGSATTCACSSPAMRHMRRKPSLSSSIASLVNWALLVVGQFRSYVVPLIIMAPLPLTVIGVMPRHALLGAQFTATSMIGMIALVGMIVRNSILLIDFINHALTAGKLPREAVIEAAVVCARPIALTGIAAMVGRFFILDDAIFQGLAVSLIFGIFVSTLLTLVIIPMLYFNWLSRSKATWAFPQPG